MNDKIFLCSICNINSGTCLEDCKFCSQSVRYKADIDRYKQKDIENILDEAKRAKQFDYLSCRHPLRDQT